MTRATAAAVALLAMTTNAACGEEDRAADNTGVPVAATTVEQVVRDPESWDQRSVRVRGEAFPRENGFLLVQDGSAIWVAAPGGVDGVEAGDRVVIRAEVERLLEGEVDRVVEALRRPAEPGLPRPEADAIEQTPAEVGEPFLVFRALLSGGETEQPEEQRG